MVQNKKPREDPKSEFNLHGIKKIPAEFNGMSGTGICRHLHILSTFRNKIVRNKFFELSELYKFISAWSLKYKSPLDADSNSKMASEPQTKTEVFELLYLFGMFYLQVFPEKMLGFLNHCSYLTTCSKTYHVPGLLHLDSALRELYITNPEWNWSQDHYEVIDVRTAFANDDSVKMSKVKENKAVNKSKYDARGLQPQAGNQSYSRGHSFRGQGVAMVIPIRPVWGKNVTVSTGEIVQIRIVDVNISTTVERQDTMPLIALSYTVHDLDPQLKKKKKKSILNHIRKYPVKNNLWYSLLFDSQFEVESLHKVVKESRQVEFVSENKLIMKSMACVYLI